MIFSHTTFTSSVLTTRFKQFFKPDNLAAISVRETPLSFLGFLSKVSFPQFPWTFSMCLFKLFCKKSINLHLQTIIIVYSLPYYLGVFRNQCKDKETLQPSVYEMRLCDTSSSSCSNIACYSFRMYKHIILCLFSLDESTCDLSNFYLIEILSCKHHIKVLQFAYYNNEILNI